MENQQKSTEDFLPTPAEVQAVDQTMPSELQQIFIDYKATNGLIFDVQQTDDAGDFKLRHMSVTEFADKIGVDRSTLYLWQNKIPRFWERVAERRKELSGQNRLAKIHEVWYLKAVGMKDWRITEAWLRNFDKDYKEPKAKVEVEPSNSWAALFENKRNVIEATVIEDEPANNQS